jgi:serine/threonine protein kinase
MKLYCTRPNCSRPVNEFADLDDESKMRSCQQKYCITCGMPLFLQNRYVPIDLLDSGGFGAAFLARDILTPRMRQCVVKQFKPATVLTTEELQIAHSLFKREAEGLEDLGATHGQIPHLYAFFDLTVENRQVEERFFYLVIELIEGETLEKVAKQQAFTEAEVIDVLSQVLPVLQFIHDRGVIHRDIKPSNIMRDRQYKLHLLDFGAIKNIAQPGRTIVYSPGYAPPEQLRGQKVFFASDIYGLGATCLFLLTQKKPEEMFDVDRNQWDWQKHISLSPILTEVFNKMLALAPIERFQSAEEVLISLAPLLPDPITSFTTTTLNLPPEAAIPLYKRPLGEYLTHAAFTGTMGGLWWLLIEKIPLPVGINIILLTIPIAILIFTQSQRIITKRHFPIAIAVSLVIILLAIHATIVSLLLASAIGIVVGINLSVIFRLVYRLLLKSE